MSWRNKKILKIEIEVLKESLAELKLQKKIEEEDIKHLVKINEERQKLELERERMKLKNDKDGEVEEIRDKYRDKIEARLEVEVERTKEMYVEILQRLPNINVELTGGVKKN